MIRRFLLNLIDDKTVIYFEVDKKGHTDVFVPLETHEDGKSNMLKIMTLGRKATKDYLAMMTGIASKSEKDRIIEELRSVVTGGQS